MTLPVNLIPWTRYWIESGKSFNRDGTGFVSGNSESQWLGSPNPDLMTYEEIQNAQCLILVGEPGAGKSVELELAEEAEEKAGNKTLRINLSLIVDPFSFQQELVEHAGIHAWLQGAYQLSLFLDSFDEGQLRYSVLPEKILSWLSALGPHIERLKLRIACRSADLPSDYVTRLKSPQYWGKSEESPQEKTTDPATSPAAGIEELFDAASTGTASPGQAEAPEIRSDGNDHVYQFSLVPLTHQAISLASDSRKIDRDKFLQEIANKKAIPLAEKPVTLFMLLGVFSQGETFPESAVRLYEKCTSILCAERNKGRQAQSKTTGRPIDAEMAVARELAAIMLLANKAEIYLGTDVIADDSGLLCFDEIEESIGRQKVELICESALFERTGDRRYRWAHQTFAEFLAAWHLKSKGMDKKRLLSFLAPRDHYIVPQLREMLGWILNYDEALVATVVSMDPDIVLRCDLDNLRDETKQLVIDALLQHIEAKRNLSFLGERDILDRLKHPELADQIRPWIADQSRFTPARQVALLLAEHGIGNELNELLLARVLDQNEDPDIRYYACDKLRTTRDQSAKPMLKEFIKAGIENDDKHKIIAVILDMLWPDDIGLEELLEILNLIEADPASSDYEQFIEKLVSDNLTNKQVCTLLDWMSGRKSEKRIQWRTIGYSGANRLLALAIERRVSVNSDKRRRPIDPQNCAAFAGECLEILAEQGLLRLGIPIVKRTAGP